MSDIYGSGVPWFRLLNTKYHNKQQTLASHRSEG